MTALEFLLSRLEASGLSAAEAVELGIKWMEKAPASIGKAGPGFNIPYFDKKGKRLSTFRYRRDLESRTGWDKLTESPKYLQPAGTPPEIYLAPFKHCKWVELLADTEEPLYITEGELKAAAACKHELTCIGIGGVWSWRSARSNTALLPALKDIAWEERKVYIVYDSDAATNPDVFKAEQALCAALRELKAVPHVVRLPTLQGHSKTGLDDYLLSEGKAAFIKLCSETEADPLTDAIDEMNTKVAFIKAKHEIYELGTSRFISDRKFVHLVYADEYVEQKLSNGKMARVQIAPAWVKSKRRAVFYDLMFKPGHPRIIHTTTRSNGAQQPIKVLNTWEHWLYEPKQGDVSLFTELLDYFCQNESKEARTWLEQWFAYPIQFPGTKLYSAVVVWSNQTGTGKSFLGEIVGGIYGKNYTAVTHAMLEKNFNGWAENKQFIMGSEITGNESRRFADQLKDMITRSTLHVERKYVDSYEMDDCANYYFTSNHSDAFFLEDQDRRFFVIDASFKPLPAAFYKRCDEYFKKGSGRSALMHHLLTLDLTGFDPSAKAYGTTAKTSMTESSMSGILRWVKDFKNNRDKAITRTIKGLENMGTVKLFTSRELFRTYQAENDDDRKSTMSTLTRTMTLAGLDKVYKRSQVDISKTEKEYLWADPIAHPHLFRNISGPELAKLYHEERKKSAASKERKF